jgi:hypothetical protein
MRRISRCVEYLGQVRQLAARSSASRSQRPLVSRRQATWFAEQTGNHRTRFIAFDGHAHPGTNFIGLCIRPQSHGVARGWFRSYPARRDWSPRPRRYTEFGGERCHIGAALGDRDKKLLICLVSILYISATCGYQNDHMSLFSVQDCSTIYIERRIGEIFSSNTMETPDAPNNTFKFQRQHTFSQRPGDVPASSRAWACQGCWNDWPQRIESDYRRWQRFEQGGSRGVSFPGRASSNSCPSPTKPPTPSSTSTAIPRTPGMACHGDGVWGACGCRHGRPPTRRQN